LSKGGDTDAQPEPAVTATTEIANGEKPGIVIEWASQVAVRPRPTITRLSSTRGAIWSWPSVPMLKIKKIDHIAVCVADIDEAAARWHAVLGLVPREREVVESQKTEAILLPVGDTSVELISPRGNDSLSRFLEKRGPGLHHIAVEVEGIESAIALLKGLGLPMIDETPRRGARGHKVAFIHPKATGGVLVELVEPAASEADEAKPVA
jgi:methylmalonyl-CoA/ethylmalonyl-CoA epimerase